jgi:signal transduction histidine kinase
MQQENSKKKLRDADHQRNLFQSTIDLQEKERKQIASELHEKVGALLSAARLNLGMILNRTTPENEVEKTVEETKQMIDETIESVRRLSNNLIPTSLEKFGLSRALNELCASATTPQTSVIYKTTENSYLTLNETQQLLLFRIAQELIDNSLKHSEGSVIEVNLNSDTSLSLSVIDNGKGFDIQKIKNESSKGLGLNDIENRVSLLRGKIDFESKSSSGTSITIKLNIKS